MLISLTHTALTLTESYDESDTNLRGLDFNSLPVQSAPKKLNPTNFSSKINLRTMNYKYPCQNCLGPCKKGQDSIQCTVCDNWVHQKCTDLSYAKFLEYCLPENSEKPYYCENCEFGSTQITTNQTCASASAKSIFLSCYNCFLSIVRYQILSA